MHVPGSQLCKYLHAGRMRSKCYLYFFGVFTTTTAPAAISSKRFSDGFNKI